MISERDFIDLWKYPMAGVALFGAASDSKDGTLKRSMHAYEIPAMVEKLLAEMHSCIRFSDLPTGPEDLEPLPEPVPPTLSELIEWAKRLPAEDRAELRRWVELQPKQPSVNGQHPKPTGAISANP